MSTFRKNRFQKYVFVQLHFAVVILEWDSLSSTIRIHKDSCFNVKSKMGAVGGLDLVTRFWSKMVFPILGAGPRSWSGEEKTCRKLSFYKQFCAFFCWRNDGWCVSLYIRMLFMCWFNLNWQQFKLCLSYEMQETPSPYRKLELPGGAFSSAIGCDLSQVILGICCFSLPTFVKKVRHMFQPGGFFQFSRNLMQKFF